MIMVQRRCLYVLLTIILLVAAFQNSNAIAVPPSVIKSVAFVYVPNPKTGAPVPAGTCFFIGTPVKSTPGRIRIYAITAKHVLRTSETLNSTIFPWIWLRLNGLNSEPATMVKLNLRAHGPGENVFYHSDPTVDIAVISLPSSVFGTSWHYDQAVLDESLLTTSDDVKSLKIGPGTDLFFAGMFDLHLGDSENTPIVRFGRVSMLPGERIRFGQLNEEVLLAEMFSFGGNSGSPVFYYMGLDRYPGSIVVGQPVIKIAGVMQGFFTGNEPLDRLVVPGSVTAKRPDNAGGRRPNTLLFFPPNSGIAAIIPAQKILDILHSAPLSNQE